MCNDLPPLANGMIIYNVSEGSHRTVATYTCDEGFQLLGDEIRTCEDGVWAEASPFQCTQEGVLRYVTIIPPCNNSTTVCSDWVCMHVVHLKHYARAPNYTSYDKS